MPGDMTLVAINEIADAETVAHLARYDSTNIACAFFKRAILHRSLGPKKGLIWYWSARVLSRIAEQPSNTCRLGEDGSFSPNRRNPMLMTRLCGA